MKILSRQEIRKLIGELQAQKNQLDERLSALEVMDKWLAEMEEKEATSQPQTVSPQAQEIYAEISLRDACLSIVRDSNELWTARQVTERAISGGYPFRTERPETSVATTLRRLASDIGIRLVRTNRGIFFKRLEESAPANAESTGTSTEGRAG